MVQTDTVQRHNIGSLCVPKMFTEERYNDGDPLLHQTVTEVGTQVAQRDCGG